MSKFAQLENQSIVIEAAMDEIVVEGAILDKFFEAARTFYEKLMVFIDRVKEIIQGINSKSESEKLLKEGTVNIYLNKKNKATVDKAMSEFDRITKKYDGTFNGVLSKIKTSNNDGIIPLLTSLGNGADQLEEIVHSKLKEVEDGGLVDAPKSDLKDLTSIKRELDIVKDCGKSVDEMLKFVKDRDMTRGFFASIQKYIAAQRACITTFITIYSHDLAAYNKLVNAA